MLTSTLIVAALALAASAIDPARRPRQPLGNGDKLLTFNDTVVSPKFGASSRSVQWIATGEDGQYITSSDAGLVFESIATGNSETFVSADKFPPNTYDYSVRADLQKVLFATDYVKQYRHSYFANYFVLDVASGELSPIIEDQAGDIQYAEFAPAGDAIAFVRGNNLFLSKNGTVTQITSDGGPDKFHAVPDWVYEEEIYGDRKTLWFSPDGEYVAYLSFDETGVETFTIPYYMDGKKYAPVYPEELELRYPKVGTKNPTVELTLLSVADATTKSVPVDAFPADDLIIGEVVWLTSKHASVMYRAYNRVQDLEKLVLVDVAGDGGSSVIRERDGTDGWLEPMHAVQYVGGIRGSCNQSYYVDLSDESGWMHLYLYPVKGGEAKALTSGEFEVTSVLKIDTVRQLIYFQSTEHHSTERHVYSVSYATGEKKALVDDSVSAYWTASFSSNATYYILSYQGPDVPYQELYSVDSSEPLKVITSNQALWDRIQEYNLPNITYFELEHPSGFTLNVMQRLPANFDASKKYPILLIPYGGPNAQEVHKRFQSLNSWKAYIASDPELEYITYTVDNRGTGFKGRAFRSTVTAQLGKLEAEDQTWAAEQIAGRFPFVDRDHVGIMGWSYGGFLSSKVVELDSGVFSLAIIGAPVTDWRFYDTMYTERYMKTAQGNAAGYNATAVRNTAGFKNIAGGSYVIHGTGDDNVHYQNTAALIDLLVGERVPPQKLHWQAHTDSDHSVVYNGAGLFKDKTIVGALFAEKERQGAGLSHQWSRKRSAADQAKFHF